MKKFDPDTYEFSGSPVRITLHWTGGSHTPSSLDAEHYQFLIDGDGVIWEGVYSIADQDSTSSSYAAHTASFNTKNIGVSLCGMAGSQENGSFGSYPITPKQWEAAVGLCALLCTTYDIEPIAEYLASHCEIQAIHGVKQSGKWDVSAVEFLEETWTELNDVFRGQVYQMLLGPAEQPPLEPTPPYEITVLAPAGVKVTVVTVT